jgi:hypothetical protein
MSEVTQILTSIEQGDPKAAEELLPLVYQELRRLAASKMAIHYFAGLTHQETAQVLSISEKTVRRHWNFARVWLYQCFRQEEGGSTPSV